MTSNNDTPAAQLNIASEQRNAAHDYCELASIGSLDVVLATWSPQKLDDTAKFNPNLFNRRYGFSASTPVRASVIEFQRQYDLLDQDIRWLRRAGHIQITRKAIKIDTSSLTPILGWLQFLMMGVFTALMFLQIGTSSAPAWKQALGFSVVGVFSFAVMLVSIKLNIVPWRTLRECGVVGDKRRKSGDGSPQA
jgi:hypothetical protein